MRISDWSSDVCSSDLFDLGVTTVTAEEIVHQFEHQLGVEDEQRSAAQRLDLYQVEAGGYIQRVHVLTEFHHLHTSDGHIGRTAQHVEHADAGVSGDRKSVV